MIDPEAYLKQLWDLAWESLDPAGRPWTAPDIDTTILERLPALTWNISGDGQQASGPGLWTFVLNANIFGDGMDAAKALARAVTDVVEAWGEDPRPTRLTVDGYRMAIASADQIDIPTRLARSEIDGIDVVQYAGSWSLAIRGVPTT